MARTYDPRRGYTRTQDVRDWTALVDDLADDRPTGILWPLIGLRRAGKTWALHAVRNHLKDRGDGARASYLQLRDARARIDSVADDGFALLDEPGQRLEDGAAAFLDACERLRQRGVRVLLALTPAEWRALRDADRACGIRIDAKDERHILGPIGPDEAARMGARHAAAPAFVAWLGKTAPAWTRSPFLLELILSVAEEGDLWSTPDAAIDGACHRALRSPIEYMRYVYGDSLTVEQRDVIRAIARGLHVSSEDVGSLEDHGLLSHTSAGWRVGDPILAAELAPLVIHHVSDIHFGDPDPSRLVDAKDGGTAGTAMAAAVGPPDAREDYLHHLTELASNGQGAHILVVSGDMAERGLPDELRQARAFVDHAAERLASHPKLDPDTDRVLVVGGNHDVDWAASRKSPEPWRRHDAFATAFDGLPHPRLHEPPAGRELSTWRIAELDLELVLLGSSELGGEIDRQPAMTELLDLVDRLSKDAHDESDRAKAAALRSKAAQLDPGLVHHEVLRRIAHPDNALPIRIAVLHHPISPLPQTEVKQYAGLVNAGAVKAELLSKRFCLVLHGHCHLGWFGEESWPDVHDGWTLRIAAAPTLSSRARDDVLGFNVVRILPDWRLAGDGNRWERALEVEVRRCAREMGRWDPDCAVLGPFAPGVGS